MPNDYLPDPGRYTADAVDVRLSALDSLLYELARRPMTTDQRDRFGTLLYRGFRNAFTRPDSPIRHVD